MSKNIKKYPKWVLDCYDVKNSPKRWRSCVLKKKQSKKVKKHITINGENIKKFRKWMLDCYDVKNSQKRWGSCVLKKKQSKKVKKHITINDENTKKFRKYWQLVTNYNRLKKKGGDKLSPSL